MAMYRGVVPDELLERFADAIMASEEMPRVHDDAPEDRQWIIGRDPHSHSLLLARRRTVERMAEHAAAKAWSETWGQFLSLTGGGDFCEGREYTSFLQYLGEQLPLHPNRTIDELWEEYRRLCPCSQRLPLSDDEFDQADFEMEQFDRGQAVPDLRQMALWELPKRILKEFGDIESGGMMGGGDFVFLDPERRVELEGAMEELGFTLIEDDVLLCAAQNSPGDPTEVYRRLYQNFILDRLLLRMEAVAEGEWPLDDEEGMHPEGLDSEEKRKAREERKRKWRERNRDPWDDEW